MSANNVIPLLEFLDGERRILLAIRPRLELCVAFEKELTASTRGKRFWIRNDRLWHMMLDHADMLVIDLCSWAESIYSGKTRIKKIINVRQTEVTRRRQWGASDGTLDQARYDRDHCEAFSRLFPCLSADIPSEKDIEDLRKRLQLHYKPLARDRSNNRAHRYENREASARAEMLGFGQISAFYDFGCQLIADLWLVADGGNLDFSDVSPMRARDAAADTVDLVILGSMEESQALIGTVGRQNFYERLHAIHEILGTADEPFNDGRFLYPEA